VKSVKVLTYGKINLHLKVLSSLPSGYHKLFMLFQTVNLCDELSFEEINKQITIDANNNQLPTTEKNLCFKTAKLLQERFKITKGVNIKITKDLPIGAGMGGGSSNAAGTIFALDKLWDLKLSDENKKNIALEIGADVAFFLQGGTSWAEGIGEILTPAKIDQDFHILICAFPFEISSAWAYKTWDERKIQNTVMEGHSTMKKHSLTFKDITNLLKNDLETVSLKHYPQVKKLRDFLDKKHLPNLMTGSGPTVFALHEDINFLRDIEKALKTNFPKIKTYLTTPKKEKALEIKN